MKVAYFALTFLAVLSVSHCEEAPTKCGFLNSPCCGFPADAGQCSVTSLCNAGLTCVDKVCKKTCGGLGQPCCNKECTVANAECVTLEGSDICVQQCGGKGQLCCPDGACDSGFECNKGKCSPCSRSKGCKDEPSAVCGAPGQPCCGKNCLAGSFCSEGTKMCVPYCGAAGQLCCPEGARTDDQPDGCSDAAHLYCETSSGTGLCTYDCGKQGQQCCGDGYCNTGFKCISAQCVPNNDCGSNAKPCCAQNTLGLEDGCGSGQFCDSGICRPDCGKFEGQPCCWGNNWCDSTLGLTCSGNYLAGSCVRV